MSAKDPKNSAAKEWEDWKVKNVLDFASTAVIYSRNSVKKFKAKTYYDFMGGWGDDDDIVVTEHEYNQINIKVIPQIGLRAGVAQKWIFIEPGNLKYDDTENKDDALKPPTIYVGNDCLSKENELIDKILSSVHDLEYESDPNDNVEIISISNMRKEYIQIPLILNNKKMSELLKCPQIISDVILELLGVVQLIINFIPNGIFKSPMNVNIIDGMSLNEINSLIVTNLFIKYKDKNIKSVPRFVWSNNKGIYTNYHAKTKLSEYTLLFNGAKDDMFGLQINNDNDNDNKCYMILNIVGYGYKILYFNDFKKVTFKDLIKEFYDFTNIDDTNCDEDIIAIYPKYFTKSNKKKNNIDLLRKIFYPRTRYREREQLNKVYPNKQEKKYMTFNFEEYAEILDKTLFELNLDINGIIIEIYNITGPCIQVTYASMVGDSRIMDVNFNWSLDVFKMYATKFGHGSRFYIENAKNKETLYDICKEFKNSNYNHRVVCRY